jgi:hypothetical protein
LIPLFLALAAFVGWSVIGLAVLAAARLEVTELRVALTAPAVGSVVMVLALFLVSRAGFGLQTAGVVTIASLLGASGAILTWLRPRVPLGVLPVLAICVANLLVLGWPFFHFGFNWIANANDDMANYVLAATKLLDRGLIAPLDVEGLTHDRDLPSVLQLLHTSGTRPGSDLGLAGVASISGHRPDAIFMPTILALNLSLIAAVGALAAQASRRRVAVLLAAVLAAAGPLSSYGVLQQLIAQVWGLGIAAALLSLLFVVELHWHPGPRAGDVVVIGLLLAGLALVYIELATTLIAAYAVFVAVLVVRRRIAARSLLRLWLPPLVIVAVVLNTYLVTELRFVRGQVTHGVRASGGHLFGYALVPTALPAIVGIQTLDVSTAARFASGGIVVAAVVIFVVGVCAGIGVWRGEAAAAATLAYIALAAVLAIKSADFGLFKLYMYVQPFGAAVAAAALARIPRWTLASVAAVVVGALLIGQVRTQHVYVHRSEDPIDLPEASSPALLPAVRAAIANSAPFLVSFAENPVLAKLEAADAGQKPLFLASRNILGELLSVPGVPRSLKKPIAQVRRGDGWRARSFTLHAKGGAVNKFESNLRAEQRIDSGMCRFAFPTGTELPFNRISLPEGAKPVIIRSCGDSAMLLAFVQSDLGQSFYLPLSYRTITFFQLQSDYFFRDRTFSGFGRYALFRVLHPTKGLRLELSFTTTLRHDGSNRLPPAAAIGSSRTRLPIIGRGSARVYSHPLKPQMIGGQPYLMLDMGVPATQLPVPRPGLTGLYGRSIPLDPRHLTSYVRDVSIISSTAYRSLKAPLSLKRFPEDLSASTTEYSGLYEDGWVAEDSYVVLASGAAGDLVVRGSALPLPGQRLRVFVNGKEIASRRLKSPTLEVRVRVGASPARRRVELRFTRVGRLAAPDLRPAAAHLTFVGITSP